MGENIFYGRKHTEHCFHKYFHRKCWKNRYLGALLAVLLKGGREKVCVRQGGGGGEGERERESESEIACVSAILVYVCVCVCVLVCMRG